MSYTYSWEIKSELSPSDFITWEMEEELEEDDLPPDEDDDWGNPDREDLPDDIIEV